LKRLTEDRSVVETTSIWLVIILYIANKMRLHKLPLKYEAFSRDTTEEAGSCDEMCMVVNSAHGCCFFKMTWSFGYVARLGIFKKA
jgi:hypothetical protein